jgi:hypothetical protein
MYLLVSQSGFAGAHTAAQGKFHRSAVASQRHCSIFRINVVALIRSQLQAGCAAPGQAKESAAATHQLSSEVVEEQGQQQQQQVQEEVVMLDADEEK